jgi:hypothetical protein
VAAPVRPDPPYVPIRRGGWPVTRSPRWLIVAGAVLAAGAVLVGLAYRPSQPQRASDLRGFLSDVRYDIESCAGGVSESLTALRQLGSEAPGAQRAQDVRDTIKIATYGASNCSPANNMQIDDLMQYQVSESLASFRLDRVVTGLGTWAAPDAMTVQTDVVKVLTARSVVARGRATAALRAAIRRLDAQRSAVDSIVAVANRSLNAHAAPLPLPG